MRLQAISAVPLLVLVSYCHADSLNVNIDGTFRCPPSFSNTFLSCSESIGISNFSATARASFGNLGAAANVSITGATSGGAISETAIASMTDLFTITSGPSNGFIEFAFVSGGSGSGTSGMYNGPDYYNYEGASVELYNNSTNQFTIVGLKNGISAFDVLVPYQLSTASISVYLEVLAGCQVYGGSDCAAYVNFLDTAMITGVQILDSNDNLVADSTFTTESGTNYNQASSVPEPCSLVLLATGLIAGIGTIRRKLTQ